MSKGDLPQNIKTRSTSAGVIYIGAERRKVVERFAIDVGFYGGRQVTTAHFFQYLIDVYGEQAKDNMIKGIRNQGENNQ